MDRYAKAITAALLAGLTALGVGLFDDKVTPAEWVAVAVAIVASLGLVWAVPNSGVSRDEASPNP